MAFAIKDLMITVLPPGMEGQVLGMADCGRCTDLTGGCEGCTRIQCSEHPTRGDGGDRDDAADCGRCTDLTAGCGGCTRIQCSEHPTRGDGGDNAYEALMNLKTAKLMLLKADLRLALQGT